MSDQTKTRLYYCWRNMKKRCYCKTRKDFPNWGGRGIEVCPEWKNNYKEFEKWALSHGYSDELTLDRINNDGNYSPHNCRWVSRKVQCSNTRRNIMITAWGETKCAYEWWKDSRCKVRYNTILERIQRGIDAEIALTAKTTRVYTKKPKVIKEKKKRKVKQYLAFNEWKTLKEWQNDSRCVASKSTLIHKVRNGWTMQDAMTIPHTPALFSIYLKDTKGLRYDEWYKCYRIV